MGNSVCKTIGAGPVDPRASVVCPVEDGCDAGAVSRKCCTLPRREIEPLPQISEIPEPLAQPVSGGSRAPQRVAFQERAIRVGTETHTVMCSDEITHADSVCKTIGAGPVDPRASVVCPVEDGCDAGAVSRKCCTLPRREIEPLPQISEIPE